MQSYMPHPSSQSAALGCCCPKQAKRSKKSQKSKGKKKQSFQLMSYEAFPPVTSRRIVSSFTDDKTIIIMILYDCKNHDDTT